MTLTQLSLDFKRSGLFLLGPGLTLSMMSLGLGVGLMWISLLVVIRGIVTGERVGGLRLGRISPWPQASGPSGETPCWNLGSS